MHNQLGSFAVPISLAILLAILLAFGLAPCGCSPGAGADAGHSVPARTTIRIATFNVALNRKMPGELVRELETGESSQAKMLAEIIQRVRPAILLLNEIDRDERGESVRLFCERYLAVSQNGEPPIYYRFTFAGPVNTGVDSGQDLNGDGQTGTPADAFGFGSFPGQYGMAILSRFPIDRQSLRSFQKFVWRDMPGALRPVDPKSGKDFYPPEVQEVFRLSSKSMWDVPIQAEDWTLHLICAHPTPPVFDGKEDRNGCRNHDEIRMVADYIGGQGDYLIDDAGNRGGLPPGKSCVVAGDMNADPGDGDSRDQAARQLTEHRRLTHEPVPGSAGAAEASRLEGGVNDRHQGDPAHDTGNFNDRAIGNLRVDYCLASRELEVVDCGVFWPDTSQPDHALAHASDHHLVWIDVRPADKPGEAIK